MTINITIHDIVHLSQCSVCFTQRGWRWLSYHGAAERPKPPQQSDGEQEQQDEQSYGHKGPIRLQRKITSVSHDHKSILK